MSGEMLTPPRLTHWPGQCVIIATTIISAQWFPALLGDAKSSLMIAGAGLSAWLVGREPTFAMCGVWAILEVMAKSPGSSLAGLLVRYLMMVGLIFSLAKLKRRLAEESRLARLDSLTGLPNRQAFWERCQAELSRAKRFHRPLTIALLDGDRFKQLNDQQGHAVGDRALQATAKSLQQTIRQYDFAARLGGDEFAVLFPETAADSAEIAAQRLQRELTAQMSGEFSPLCFSIGVVTFPPGDWDVQHCLEQTDRVLYDAKRAGTGLIRMKVGET